MSVLTLLPPNTCPSPSAALARSLAQLGVAAGPAEPEDRDDYAQRLETALMRLFRDSREAEAFELLYERSRGWLLRWVLHLVGGRPVGRDPLELLQDTYVNIYRYAGSFREDRGGGFRSWARTIAANVIRRARTRGAQRALQALPEGFAEPEDPRAWPDQEASYAEQSACVARAYALLLLHYAAAFERLSPRDREALTLIEVDGLSYAQAGRILRVGRSNMKMIIFRARKRIRAHASVAMDSSPGAPHLRSERAAG